jgi:hypothetical protein
MAHKTFDSLAARLMGDLMRELDLTDVQAAGIVGNFGHESGLISGRQQGTSETAKPKPVMNKDGSQPRGGIDWPQWDGVRRRAFSEWLKRTKTSYPSYEASMGFVLHELKTTPEKAAIPALKKCTTLKSATETFEKKYERAGVKAYPKRVEMADRALRLYRESKTKAKVAVAKVEVAKVEVAEEKKS